MRGVVELVEGGETPIETPVEDDMKRAIAENEGFLAFMPGTDDKGWWLFGFRLYSIVMLIVVAYVILMLASFYQGDAPTKQYALASVEKILLVVVPMMVVLKAKSGGP